jgi:hypothetical protein
LTATGDEDLRTLLDKALRGGKANAAVASGYDCHFPFELSHNVAPFDPQNFVSVPYNTDVPGSGEGSYLFTDRYTTGIQCV